MQSAENDAGLLDRIEALVAKWSGCRCGPQLAYDHDPRVQDCPQHGEAAAEYYSGGIVSDLRGLLDAPQGGSERRVRDEWADYFEHWTQAVGPEPLTVQTVIALLRAERKPFGISVLPPEVSA